ncbi:MAG: hypothetical protein M1828_006353 [Chrysothrix sp. TS-e1954]|nr:MAG: hypothetical protein M1828_006353 [Chrysothrix sp. TS-e1954]
MADNSLRNYGVAAPHGPNMTDDHTATQNIGDVGKHNMNMSEKEIFNHLILPDDSYNSEGQYWADMNIFKRAKFANSVDSKETRKELTSIGRMVRADPLSPVGFYFKNMVLPGAGLLLEGYVLFSIGNLKPLFQAAFPTCWGKKSSKSPLNGTACNEQWRYAVDYLEIIGIIVGQIMVGILGDWLGRRWGLIQDAAIMFLGLIMLTAAWGVNLNGWVICYAWSLFVYGVGVGGEYPMTATSGMENAVGSGKVSTREDRLHRGRKVTSAFLMQGWGQLLNQVILIIGLLIFHHGSGNPPYSEVAAQWTFRVSFAIPAAGTLWLLYYRTYKMRQASKQLQAAKKKSKVTGYDIQSLKLTFNHFGFRLVATAGAWFANDVFFYGNKLFQSDFIKALEPNSKSVMTGWLWNLVNVGVQLVGYYLASFLIDNKLYGRKWMMIVGFIGDFICFTIPAFNFTYYSKSAPHKFQVMYFLSSFFAQFGPNSVTFIVAAEVFPTAIRATAHGFSAASGKCGALVAAVVYNYLTTAQIFLFVPWWGLAGGLLTFLFLPDTTGLDLKEQERRWHYLRIGRPQDYHGVAVHPKHLSFYERLRGIGKEYNPQLDYEMKLQELRGEWEEAQARKAHDIEPEDDSAFSDDVSSYFARTAGNSIRNEKGAIYEEKSSGEENGRGVV